MDEFKKDPLTNFENDPNGRKRRFLRGLNFFLGYRQHLEDKDIFLREAIDLDVCGGIQKLRANLASIYCLEFTVKELVNLIYHSDMTTGRFTEKYVGVIYRDRGDVDLNALIGSSIKGGAIDLREMDKAPKFGLNGPYWCDVASGQCSCGATHY